MSGLRAVMRQKNARTGGTLPAVSAGPPEVSVVVATHDRPELLSELLAALGRQSLAAGRFEVIVVDDGSGPATRAVLDRAAEGELDLHVLRRDSNSGASAARNDGWRAARGALIAFTDDDCAPAPTWLEAGLRAWGGRENRFVQGATRPAGGRSLLDLNPFAHAVEVSALTAEGETCNIFYPRALLERVAGFDEAVKVGDDTELAWTARAAGAEPVFAAGAVVEHAIVPLTPLDSLRRVWRWTEAIRAFSRHPELRRQRLMKRVFWNWSHYLIVRALLALPFLRRPLGWPVALWLAAPLVRYELRNAQRTGNPLLAPFWLLRDVVELVAVVRGALRYRTFVI
jgi:glycosyltransferase involved in cell wall biosynthesis